MILATLLSLFSYRKKTECTVTSVKSVTLTLMGMRGSHAYKYEADGDQSVLERYREIYSGEEIFHKLEKSVILHEQEMVQLMNECCVMAWDGFHGEHPKNVQDGIMFRMEAAVNDGKAITADGSANFPKGYREFVRTLDERLAAGE